MGFKVFDLGLVDFKKGLDFQKEVFARVRHGCFKGALILCRHYPVITVGRTGKRENIKIADSELKARGIPVYQIERGGDVTYHGPGQLVAYPVFNLEYLGKDIHLFLRGLEKVVIDFLSDYGITGLRVPGLTGVWVDKQKIASIGIAIKNWITFHGVSLNIKRDDLAYFGLIKPCGMDIEMASMEGVLHKEVKISRLKDNFIRRFQNF